MAQELPHNADLPDRDLAVFLAGTPEMDAYRRDLFWAQEYARRNRAVMMALLSRTCVRRAVRGAGRASTSRSPATTTTWPRRRYDGVDLLVTRKGAIRAGHGDLGHHPGLDGHRLVHRAGPGQRGAYSSASHGAGRRMSRTQAKQTFTTDDLAEQTAGRGVPQGRRRGRRDPRRLQGHRVGHRGTGRPGRGRRPPQAGRLRQGLSRER